MTSPGRIASRLALAALAVYVFGFWVAQENVPSQVNLFTTAIYIGIAATGLNILTGYNGQVSIGHGAFFGLGAYISALMMSDKLYLDVAGHHFGLGVQPFLITLPVVAVVCFAVGGLIGFPALRVKGLYLALVTLGLAVLFPALVNRFVVGTGGSSRAGLKGQNLRAPDWYEFFPDSIAKHFEKYVGAPDQWAYYVTLTFGVLLLVGVFFMARSRFGRSLIAVRDHEAAASTVGIDLARTKVTAFALSALYAGLAGSFSVLIDKGAEFDAQRTFQLSIEFLLALVIGGAATVFGPMVGAFLVVFARDWIDNQKTIADFLDDPTRAQQLSPAIFGISLIIMMFFLPDGLVGGGRRIFRRLSRRRSPPSTVAPTPPVAPT